MKKLFSILLSLILVFSVVPIFSLDSFATDDHWSFDAETGVLTIWGNGKMNNYQTQYDKEHSPWYSFRDNIISVVIESGVLSIGDAAFYKCSNLKSVSIPDSVKSIGSSSFEGCSSLASVTIPNGVEEIDSYAFRGCSSLENVVIPGSVTMINHQSFGSCTNLTNITISEGVTTIATAAFLYCSSLTNVTLPDSVTYIGAMSFMECTSLVSVTIPDSVTQIMSRAFEYCNALTDIYYAGSQEQWNQINGSTVGNATIHYNYGKGFTGIKDNHFYKNDVMQKAYRLVEFEGDFYFIGDRHEIIKDRKAYLSEERINGLTYADGTPIEVGSYEFDENGKMVILNGVVGNYVYKNNTKLKAYQLVEVDGDFYFIGDRHEIVKNKRIYLNEERINGLTYADGTPITVGHYNVDADGKMIMLEGIIGNKVYKNNTLLKAYQLVEVDGDFYFIGDRHEIIKGRKAYLSEERINGLTYADGTPIAVGSYEFDENGKMIIE
ncbi:MAG: leucine-rich repeat domain-containing protein [Clostridia bacterium]|nr:leucine-rich repeat domain-containing protein [Clostridia bacterium]